MKKLKNLSRRELKNVLGGGSSECEPPFEDGSCRLGYAYCSYPSDCCYKIKITTICSD
jgi:hypothetical protein